ncbi:methyl-accepting chemotaxis protein [Hydrocarboniclastica marina]|uniref:Methyl-accepting transducer domain-containing protein n=1 Tax=Hydrocarboniclastica marina TaxID=2259620 RepID=A0A4P7XJM2_9ALTE|nr:methyl-accepting chemotaxis protein [Hydrocarboniclastica marina]QCF26754.1 hypothetical protein soil367_12880 [Hydrocarboniclastica marina]
MKKQAVHSSSQTLAASQGAAWARAIDLLMLGIIGFSCLYTIALASQHDTWGLVVGLSLPLLAVATVLFRFLRGSMALQFINAALLQIFVGLQIHQGHGLLELHFGVFVALAVTLAYRRWEPVLVSALVIAAHHVLFNALQAQGWGVFVFADGASWMMVFHHAAYVVIEASILVAIALAMQKDKRVTDALAQATRAMQSESGSVNLDFTVDAGDNKLLRSFGNAIEQLDSMVYTVTHSLQSLAKTLPELQADSQNISNDTQQQFNRSLAVEAATGEMAQSIEALARQTASVADASEAAWNSNCEGQSAYREASSATGKLAATLSNSAEEVHQLSASCNDIAKAVSVIDAIAEQTNLLALNAAIEAARAGDSGRGFAVVADEVRQLARRSQETTASVSAIVKTLVQFAERSQASMAEALAEVARTVDLHQRADSALAQISQSIEDIRDRGQQIAAVVEEQSSVSREVAAGAQEMKSTSEAVSQSSASNAKVLSALTQRIRELNADLQQIRTSDRA